MDIRQYLDRWAIGAPVAIDPLPGGINSAVWLVRTSSDRFVAKVAHPTQLLAGLEVSEILESSGFTAGGPVRTVSGELAAVLDGDRAMALLRFVRGRPLDRTRAEDRERLGATLGTVHSLLLRRDPPAALRRWPWRWLRDPVAGPLSTDVAARIQTAVDDAETLVHQLHLTQGVLHGDVGASDFLHDEATGRTALIDWGAAMHGPLLYDLCSFIGLARLGGVDREAFIASYRRTCSLAARELSALDAFVTLRWVVQARYFGWRISRGVTTGVADDRANEAGLKAALDALGIS